MKLLIAGDFCDKNRVKAAISEENYSLMFDGIKEVVQQADISVVNFEFPIVEKEGKPIKKCGPNLIGQKKAIDAIKYAGFNVCTLANNHILDQGEECCINTKRLLEEANVQTVGVGTNLKDASKILYIKHDEKTLAIINCCESEFSIATENKAGANPLNPIQQYYQINEASKIADYILVIVHGGHEHCQLPSLRMKETYRFFIEAGADVVINHHQHCISGYEVFKGKPIFYGLGNLLFDDPSKRNDEWNIGYMVEIEFNEVISFYLKPYIQCTDVATVQLMCKKRHDMFLEKINELNNIIQDDDLLVKNVNEWIRKRSANYKLLLTPYNNGILERFFRKGLLPTFISNRHILRALNYIECESHRERLLQYLKSNLKSNKI